jgi:hypothetical protein
VFRRTCAVIARERLIAPDAVGVDDVVTDCAPVRDVRPHVTVQS